MIEKQIFHPQLFRQLTGFPDCGMMLLIRMKDICLRIQAKCFMHQPFTVLHILPLIVIIGFIPTAGKLLTVFEIHRESILLCFCGLYIKKHHSASHNCAFLSIWDCHQMKSFSNKARLLFTQQHMGNIVEYPCNFLMGIDCSLPFILSLLHMLTNHANHPDNPRQMIDVLMGYKNLFYILPVYPWMFQLS